MRSFLLVAAITIAAPALAAAPTVRIGKIESEQRCSVYELTAGTHREAAVATRHAVGYASETSWISYLAHDCVDDFASLRTSIEAALAASGKLTVTPGVRGGSYVVSGRISQVSGGGPAAPLPSRSDGGFAISSNGMSVSMDVTLRDPLGRIVYGGLLTKKLETGFAMETAGLSSGSTRSGQELYSELQHEVALAVARTVAFRIEPLRVIGINGRRVQLNYGAPLLKLGSLVQVTAPDGATLRFTVSGAGQNSAEAEYQGGADLTHVTTGSVGLVIEPEDPAANGRRFEKVDLP